MLDQLTSVVTDGEWLVVGLFALGTVACAYLILSVQGDLRIVTTEDTNNDEQAARLFIWMLEQTRKSIVIHDDGNDSPKSVYNDDAVVAAFRAGILDRRIMVRCLFNDEEKDLKLARLRAEFPDNIEIWHTGNRPDYDIHYKVVDDGRIVHLSNHEHGVSERNYMLRNGIKGSKSARLRVSREYREHFDYTIHTLSLAA